MFRYLSIATVAFAAMTVPAATASAQDTAGENAPARTALQMRGADVVAVLNGELAPDDVFSETFLTAVPPESLAAMNAQLTAQFGKVLAVEEITPSGPYQAAIKFRFERAIASGQIALSPAQPNQIIGLQLSGFEPIDDTPGKIAADIAALPGDVGVYFAPITGGGETVFDIQADRPFAIGSTFKIYVLNALTRSIKNGERAWDDVIALDTKSLPSGQMQNWPDGAPVTVHTLATMMITISDNTATDMLIKEVGRAAVEAELALSGHAYPAANTPFLTTLELFALKANLDEARAFTGANEDAQRAAIQALDARLDGDPANANAASWQTPRMIDTLEWFASGKDIAGAMEQVVLLDDPAALGILSVNKALPQQVTDAWSYTGYKGGSEPGVLNLSWLLQAADGTWYALVMSWNDTAAPVDNPSFELLAQRILSLAAPEDPAAAP